MEPQTMVLHAALATQHIQRLALHTNAPCVLAGDFNFKPGDAAYRLVTTADTQLGAAYPNVPQGDAWTPQLMLPMKSAYLEQQGSEPDFTNYAQIQDEDSFIDTLDYVFYTPQVKVTGVLALPHRDAIGGPLPTSAEPSDHILIAAHLELPADCGELTQLLYAGKVAHSGKKMTRQEQNDLVRENLRQQLDGFLASTDTVLSFPATLSSFERKMVHGLCDEMALVSGSTGEGRSRYIQVQRRQAQEQMPSPGDAA
jgi:hypothetical protein